MAHPNSSARQSYGDDIRSPESRRGTQECVRHGLVCEVIFAPLLRIRLFLLWRFKPIQQPGIFRESLEHLEDLAAAEAGPRQPAVGRTQVFPIAEESLARRRPVFAANPFLDQRFLVDIPIDLFHGALGQYRRDAVLPQVAKYPPAAEFFAGEPSGGKA